MIDIAIVLFGCSALKELAFGALFFWDLMIHHLYCGLRQKVGRSGDGVELHSFPGFRVSVLMMDESSQQIASIILRSSKKEKKNPCKYLLQFPSGNLLQTKLYFKEKAVL